MQASLKEGVAQISEHIVSHGDIIQGLRSDHVDTFRSLEERFKHSEEEKAKLQAALTASQAALAASQKAEAKTRQALQEAGKHLTDEQTKNLRQARMLAKLNDDLGVQKNKVLQLEKNNAKLREENVQVKTKLAGLQNVQAMQEEMYAMKMNTGIMLEQLTTKFKAQDEKLDAILTQGSNIMDTVTHIETMHDVAFTGDAGCCSDGPSRKRHRSQTPADEEEETQEQAFARE